MAWGARNLISTQVSRTDHPNYVAASRAVTKVFGKPPDLTREGGSIPVAGMLKNTLGLDTIFMGFGLEDDRIHSPNEKFELSSFRLGARAHVAFIQELLEMG